MFGFFKKKDDKNRKSVETVEEITLSEEAKAELLKKIADGKALVNNDSEKSDEDLANLTNKWVYGMQNLMKLILLLQT